MAKKQSCTTETHRGFELPEGKISKINKEPSF